MESMRSALFSFKVSNDPAVITSRVHDVLRAFFPLLTEKQELPLGPDNGFLVAFTGVSAAFTFSLRYYQAEHYYTLTGDVSKSCEAAFERFTNAGMEKLQAALCSGVPGVKDVERLLVMKRNCAVPQYFEKSNNKVLEYDFDQVVHHEKSPYQDIKILHSPTLGNVLLLDDLQNLGECDINYTHGLMKFGVNSYKDKEVLILGGGDGGLLHELLKESPKFVTMVDIDGAVMNACKVHLRGACGDSLDSFTGTNYEVIVGDCLQYMKRYAEEGRQFDYVFNDLTDIPISSKDSKQKDEQPTLELWEFVLKILKLGLPLVKPDGKYLNHAIGVSCVSALEEYEKVLKQLPIKVNFTSHTAFVPSFMEEWVFYEITKAEAEAEEPAAA